MALPRHVERGLLVVLIAGMLAGLMVVVPVTLVQADGTIEVGIAGCTLTDAIVAANTDAASGNCPAGDGTDTIVLEEDEIYTLTSAADNGGNYGLSGLPAVTSNIIIEGNGATITRDSTAPAFRILRHASGQLTLRELTLSNGRADGEPFMSQWGGCMISSATLKVENSTFTGCWSKLDGAALNVETSNGAAEITGSTFYGNSGDGGGYAIATIRVDTGASLTMSNSTVVDNATFWGLLARDSGVVATLTNVTLTSSSGRSVRSEAATVNAVASIMIPQPVAINSGIFNDLGGNITSGDPNLGPLQDNGGPTLTRLPLAGSPVIDAGGTGCLEIDQRGVSRPYGLCDAGAVEVADVTAPVITPSVSGTLGDNGWYTSDVSVSWQVVEGESRVTSSSGCNATTIAADTSGTTLTCTANSAGGQGSESITIKRDATLPLLSPTVTPNPVEFGQTATASANATDAMSGIASQYCDVPDTTVVGEQTVMCYATDNAGNTSTASASFTVTDPTPPVIVPLVSGTIGNNGWYTSDVTVGWDVSDPESEIATTTGCEDITITADTSGQTITCSATSAGGPNSESITIKRDTTVPTVTYTGNQGVYDLDDVIAITCIASDAMSGIASDTCADISGQAASFGVGEHVFSATATDLAGNVTTVETRFSVGVTYTGLIVLTQQLVDSRWTEQRAVLMLHVAKWFDMNGIVSLKALALNSYRLTITLAIRLQHISPSDGQRLIQWSRLL